MTPPIDRARTVLALLAAGTPPPGWPAHVFDEPDGPAAGRRHVPKCSLIECCEPGIYTISFASNVTVSSLSAHACPAHVQHFVTAGLSWVVQ